jgi:hypothetical protein
MLSWRKALRDSNNCGQVDAPRLLVPGNMLRSLHEHGRKHGELPGYREWRSSSIVSQGW